MRMEHRWAPRRSANWAVTITHPAGVALYGRVRNISSGGALIQTSVALPPHLPVELILRATDGDTLRIHRLRAIVARADNDTVGLIFKDIEPETLATLLKRASATAVIPQSEDPFLSTEKSTSP